MKDFFQHIKSNDPLTPTGWILFMAVPAALIGMYMLGQADGKSNTIEALNLNKCVESHKITYCRDHFPAQTADDKKVHEIIDPIMGIK